MKKLKVLRGTEAKETHIREAVKLDKLAYDAQYRGIPRNCIKWFKKNPLVYLFIIDEELDKVIAYISAIPISRSLYDKFIKGQVIDTKISPRQILTYEENGTYILYLSSLVVHPEYKSTKAFSLIYDSFIREMIELSSQGIYIERVIAQGVTEKGARICRLNGLEPIADTVQGSTLYGLFDIKKYFKPISSSAKELKDIYNKT